MFIVIIPAGFSSNSFMHYHNTMYVLLPDTFSINIDKEVGLEIHVYELGEDGK